MTNQPSSAVTVSEERRVTAEDRLRLHVHDPETFSFDYDDAGALVLEIDALRSAPAPEWQGMLAEIERLRPHYQSNSMLDVGRRQLLDHFASLSAPPAAPSKVVEAEIGASLLKAVQLLTMRSNRGAWWNDHAIFEIITEIREKHPEYVRKDSFDRMVAGPALAALGEAPWP